jgi:hypothetical protein
MRVTRSRKLYKSHLDVRLSCFAHATTPNWCNIGRATIDILPEDVLLVIFDYYLAEAGMIEEWQKLVHVCQKWRYAVFRSPLRLNLQILCLEGTPVGKKLAVWPPLPIIIRQFGFLNQGEDNILAALGHNDRVCTIDLSMPSSQMERVFAAMQKTFVALKFLRVGSFVDGMAPAVSDSFLGGSAPHLRHLRLIHIPFPFPVIRKLLLSAPNLVTLSLRDITHSGYISPEAIVTCLSALTRLEKLAITFQPPAPQPPPPRQGRHLPPTRSVLPALTKLTFNGVSEYLEDLVTRIDAPLLDHFLIIFFHQLIFDTPQLVQFISRTPKLELKECDEARVVFTNSRAIITLPGRDNLGFILQIACKQSDRQLSSLAQICRSSFTRALIPMLEHLYILEDEHLKSIWKDGLECGQWLELLSPFTTVKNLYLSQGFIPLIVPTLEELVEESVTDSEVLVLPNLQSIFLEGCEEAGFVPEVMQEFIAAQQFSSRPIAVSHWTR